MCVCSSYVPDDIEHTQCPRRFFNPKEIPGTTQALSVATKLRHRNTAVADDCNHEVKQSRLVGHAMPCHRTGYDRYDIHILACVEREKKKRNKQRKQTNRKALLPCTACSSSSMGQSRKRQLLFSRDAYMLTFFVLWCCLLSSPAHSQPYNRQQ